MRLVALMLSLFMIGCAADSKREAPVAVEGVMDLSDWDFERDGPVELRGEWAFGRQVDVGTNWVDAIHFGLVERVQVPHLWAKGANEEEPISVFGYGSYALRLILPESVKQDRLDVAFGDTYLQGDVALWDVASRTQRTFMAKGRFCTEASACGYAYSFEPVGRLDVGEDLELLVVVRSSNFLHGRNAGLWRPPSLATSGTLIAHSRWRAWTSAFATGILGIIWLYFGALFLIRPQDQTPLLFSLICLGTGARQFVQSGLLPSVGLSGSQAGVELLFRIEYAAMPLLAYAAIAFVTAFFEKRSMAVSFWLRLLAVWSVALGLFTVFTDVSTFTQYLLIYQLELYLTLLLLPGYVILALKERRPFAKAFMVATLIASAGTLNDLLHAMDIIETGLYAQFTFVVFVLLQSIFIAKKFSNAMDERDAKSQELLSTYQQLDDELLKRENLEASNQALARENEIAAQQLIQADKLATMGTMVAGVAHDIANPTGLIQGSTVLMEETRDTLRTTVLALFEGDSSPESLKLQSDLNGLFDDLDRSARDVMLGADRIKAINSAIRNQARSDQGHSSVALGELIDECLTVVSHRLKGIGVDVRVPEDFKVELIRSQFGQVLMNLLSNAADAIAESEAKADGKIRVEVEALSGERFALSIDDNGPGVPAELRAKILEPFFTTKGVGKGTGLGMPIVLRILDNHGMKLEILDAPELGGARFRLKPSEKRPSAGAEGRSLN